MLSCEHVVNIVHYSSHLIRANEGRSTESIDSTVKLEVLLDLSSNSDVALWSDQCVLACFLISNKGVM